MIQVIDNAPPVVMEEIIKATAAAYGLSAEDLHSPSRPDRIAWPRMVAMHLARHARMSGRAVAAEFNCCPSNVSYANAAVAERLSVDAAERARVEALREQIVSRL